MLTRLITASTLALAGWCVSAAPALADSQTSSNWAGYAVHGKGASFRQVHGQWRVPTVDCQSGFTTYSAMWVGIGGFSTTSKALEQTGTEADCIGSAPKYSAWYELVPRPSHTLSLTVRPGDLMRALVVVGGHRVMITLSDLTRHRRFRRTFTDSVLDISSAEWILEAPFDCSGSRCVTLPLSDFHRAAFSLAHVTTVSGRSGTITNAHWHTTRITLTAGGRRIVGGGPPIVAGGATAGPLSAGASAFSLRYTTAPIVMAPAAAQAVSSPHLRH